MIIDLTAAEAAVKILKEELGLSRRGSCVGVDIWTHATGDHQLNIQICIFDKNNSCRLGTGPTWEIALERVKQRLIGLSIDPGAEQVTVEVQALTEEGIPVREPCPKTEFCIREKDHEGACDEIPF